MKSRQNLWQKRAASRCSGERRAGLLSTESSAADVPLEKSVRCKTVHPPAARHAVSVKAHNAEEAEMGAAFGVENRESKKTRRERTER